MKARRIAAIALLVWSCGGEPSADEATEAEQAEQARDPDAPEPTPEELAAAALDRDFPRYGAVTSIQQTVHAEPDADSAIIGWLRIGGQVRLAEETQRGPGCDGRWTRIHPSGWTCDGDGLEVREAPIEIEAPTLEGWKEDQVEHAAEREALVLPPPATSERLPYAYFYVKENAVPEYHRLPSRNEQRAAVAMSERFTELMGIDEARARRYLAGESDDGPAGTRIANRYLDRGFYVASNGVEVRAFRRFVRTTQGRYIKQAQLETRNGHDFAGVELSDELTLPIAWTVRTSRPMILSEGEEGPSFEGDEDAEPILRQTRIERWTERRNIGGRVMHVFETDEGTRYLRAWFAAVAEAVERPSEVADDEPWVHVDLSEQTLVMYEGDRPIYATLVSSGVDEHETPTGLFTIRQKHITDTMSNIGPDADSDRYSIEDVPWTQYFEGSFALHTAFWHTGFGLPRSHGCVNLTPDDAHFVFAHTWPQIPDGWHGVVPAETELPASHVLVTD